MSHSPVNNERIFLSLGSNLGDRGANLQQAVAMLGSAAEIVALSSIYETEPVEFTEQPWFLNAAVEARLNRGSGDDAPELLLARLLEIEHEMGRRRELSVPKGPRLIDIDLLLFGARVIKRPELTLPHPAMHLRRFVLEPLAEIAPQVVHPLLHKSIFELLHGLPPEDSAVRRIGALQG